MSSFLLSRLSRAVPVGLRPSLSDVNITRNCGWIRDWKPAAAPKTEAERIAAAKKYYLIPEDYEVNDESEGFGDYPKLPPVGMDARDPYEDLDYHYYRRNYGETLHVDADIYTSDRNDPNEKHRYTPRQMLTATTGYFAFFFILHAISEYFDFRICNPTKPKQFPGPGKVHYTFEPDE